MQAWLSRHDDVHQLHINEITQKCPAWSVLSWYLICHPGQLSLPIILGIAVITILKFWSQPWLEDLVCQEQISVLKIWSQSQNQNFGFGLALEGKILVSASNRSRSQNCGLSWSQGQNFNLVLRVWFQSPSQCFGLL